MTRRVAMALFCACGIATAAAAQSRSAGPSGPAPAKKAAPLTIKEQGSFFVGGEPKTIASPAAGPIPASSGEVTVNQMYVQYQIPM